MLNEKTSVDGNESTNNSEILLARKRAIDFLKRIPENMGVLISIDKAIAKDLLTLNVKNRNESPNEIKKLVKEMNAGYFKFNGDTIRYDRNYDQCDGQTRITAFIMSDLEEIKLMFVTGLDIDVITTIDKGRKRTTEHDYQIAGIKQSGKLPAIVKLILGYKTGDFIAKKSIKSDISLRFEADNSEKLQIAATKGMQWYNRDRTKATSTILSACYFLFAEKSEEQADAFFEGLISGVNLYDGSPILTLSKFLSRQKTHLRHESTTNVIIGLNHIIHAWNKYRNNENLKAFKNIDSDSFLNIK
jgi:hypothetical protein